MCAAFRSHRKSATSSGSRSRPSARQFNRDVLTLDEAATPYERGPHCASQQIKLRNVPFGSRADEVTLGGHVRFTSNKTSGWPLPYSREADVAFYLSCQRDVSKSRSLQWAALVLSAGMLPSSATR